MVSNPRSRRRRTGLAILQLIASGWALSTLDASAKWVMEAGVTLLLLCWVRLFVHTLVALAIALRASGVRVLHARNPRWQLLRGFFMLAGTLSFFTTLRYLPQSEATSIAFLAPLLVLLVAPWLLREAPQLSHWLAAGCGFLGVLIVVRPGSGLDPIGILFGLLSACLFTGQYVSNRMLAHDNPFTTVVWSGATGSVALTLAFPLYWSQAERVLQQLSAWQWAVLVSIGVWGAVGHLLQIRAYANAPASLLSPFLYAQIIAATALGWAIGNHFPDVFTWLGISLIIASGVAIMLHEVRGAAPPRR